MKVALFIGEKLGNRCALVLLVFRFYLLLDLSRATLHHSQKFATWIGADEIMSHDIICDPSCLLVLIVLLSVLKMIF